VNGITVGKGGGNKAFNTAIGNNALERNTIGSNNTASGSGALGISTTGTDNTAVGYYPLASNTTGSRNTAYGSEALAYNIDGTNNTAIGYRAGVSFITNNLSNTTAIGSGATVVANNTIQLGNVDVTDVKTSGTLTAGTVTYPNIHGTSGQVLSTTGSGTLTWTAVSRASQWTSISDNIYYNTGNVGIGTTTPTAKLQVVGGDRNNMLRVESDNNASLSLKNTNANAGGGEYQLFVTSSNSNPSIAAGSLGLYYDHPTTSPGYRLSINKDGNVGIGTGMPSAKLDIAGNVKASGTITAGTVSYPNTHNSTTGQVLTINNTGTASWTSASSSGVPYTGATGAVNLEGYDLTVNGMTVGTGKVNGSSTHNTIVGGSGVPRTFTSVVSNTAIGYNTLTSSTPGNSNTVVGAWSLVSNTGRENSAVGVGALERNLGGNENTAIGYYAMRNNLQGSGNTALGYGADFSADNNNPNPFNNATAIGYKAKVSASNTIQLGADGTNGTTAISNVKTSGTITAGDVTYPKTHGSANQVLSTTGGGTLVWTTPSSGGVTSIGAISGSSTANGASITSGVLNLAPADASNGGVVTTGTQTFAGTKTFANDIVVSGSLTANAAVTSEITSSFTIDANNAETYKGKIIICNPSAAMTITFAASLPTGFNCMVLQKSADANKITFAGSSVTIKNRNNYTATAGNYALATIVHIGGNIIVTAGDMQ